MSSRPSRPQGDPRSRGACGRPVSHLNLPRLVHAHVPLDQAADLAGRVAPGEHALDELVVLRLRVRVLLGLEADDGQEGFDLREHPLLDDVADLLVCCPSRRLAVMPTAVTQRALYDPVSEGLRAVDAGCLPDLGKL